MKVRIATVALLGLFASFAVHAEANPYAALFSELPVSLDQIKVAVVVVAASWAGVLVVAVGSRWVLDAVRGHELQRRFSPGDVGYGDYSPEAMYDPAGEYIGPERASDSWGDVDQGGWDYVDRD